MSRNPGSSRTVNLLSSRSGTTVLTIRTRGIQVMKGDIQVPIRTRKKEIRKRVKGKGDERVAKRRRERPGTNGLTPRTGPRPPNHRPHRPSPSPLDIPPIPAPRAAVVPPRARPTAVARRRARAVDQAAIAEPLKGDAKGRRMSVVNVQSTFASDVLILYVNDESNILTVHDGTHGTTSYPDSRTHLTHLTT